jgi:hypothetical protein
MNVSRVTALEGEGIGTAVWAMAVAPDGSRAYLAARGGHLGEMLAVVDLVDGVPAPARWYRVRTDPLPPGQHNEAVGLLVDLSGSKLYLALSQGTPEAEHNLAVVDLVDGEPAGLGRVHDGGLKNVNLTSSPRVNAMVRHPHRPLLYVVGHASPGVAVHTLDGGGEPGGSTWVMLQSPANFGRHDVAIDAEGRRLYLSGHMNQLHVVDLDETSGMPQPSTQSAYDFGRGPDNVDGLLRFEVTSRAVYRRPRLATGVANWPLQLWRLDGDGHPVDGGPETFPALASRCATVSADGQTLLVVQDATTTDQITGEVKHTGSVLRAAPLDADGRPGPPVDVRRLPRRSERPGRPVLAALADTGAAAVLTHDMTAGSPKPFLANEVSGWHLRIKPEAVAFGSGPPLKSLRFVLIVPGTVVLDKLVVGAYSDWTAIKLDTFLAGQIGNRRFQFEVRAGATNNGVDLERLDLLFEVVEPPLIEGQEPRLVKAVRDTVTGTGTGSTLNTSTPPSRISLLLPGYDVRRDDRLEAIETLRGYAERLQQAAEAVALPDEQRPRQYPISASAVSGGLQGNLPQLIANVRTIRALGINTAIVGSWSGLPAAAVDQVLDEHGLTRRSAANYSLPAMFDFDKPSMEPAALQQWAHNIVRGVIANNGAEPSEIIDVKMADEPGIYLPSAINDPRWGDPRSGWLAEFHDYLRRQGFEPGDLGASGWSDVRPIGAGGVDGTDGRRRLFRATIRYLVESATNAARAARRAVDAELPGPALLDVNTNNAVNRWYKGYPGKAADKNPDNPNVANPAIGPNMATLGFDWIHAGRTDAFTPFSNITTGDHQAQYASYLGDVLRSAAQHGDQSWAAYLKANVLGTNPEGPSYKLLSMVGHGAALIDLFTWGPTRLVGGDGWSDTTQRYRHIARAIGLIGQAEPYLLGATPATGSVAILSPGGSELWDPDNQRYRYDTEVEYLHSALIHSGYPVDFVDEIDLEQGTLKGYHALYVTSPNLSGAAQNAVATWVHAGGVLAVTPGAITADELDRPTPATGPPTGVIGPQSIVDIVLGLTARDRARFPDQPLGAPVGTITFSTDLPATTPFSFPDGVGQTMPVAGPVTGLTLGAATAVATFQGTGKAAVSAHRYGRGLGIAYGFFPGAQYDRTADRSRITRLPAGWGPTERAVVAAPASAAAATRPVDVALPAVEACRLDAPTPGRGAVILLNWAADPTPETAVRIHRTSATTVQSIRHGTLPAELDGTGTLHTKVPLDDVDILLLDQS